MNAQQIVDILLEKEDSRNKSKNTKTKVGAAGATDTGKEEEKKGAVKRKDAAMQQMPFV